MPKLSSLLVICFALLLLNGCDDKKETDQKDVKMEGMTVSTSSEAAKTAFNKGLESLDEGDFLQARINFTDAIAKDSAMAIAYAYRSNTGNSVKEFNQDLANAQKYADKGSSWEKMYIEGVSTFNTGDYTKRVELGKKMTDSFPKDPRAHRDLGSTYQAANETEKARAEFQKAIELGPKWTGGYNDLANSYLFSDPKDFKKAEENASKVVELKPTSPAAQILLGDAYRAQNDLAKAKTAYAKAVELGPKNAAGYYKLGHANTFLGNYDEARKNYVDGAGHDDKDNLGAMFNTANTYLYAGDIPAAKKYLMDNCMKIDASSASADRKTSNKLACLNTCMLACFHTGDVAGYKSAFDMTKPLTAELEKDFTTAEGKMQQKAGILNQEGMWLALSGDLAGAKAKAAEEKTALESIKEPNKLQANEFLLGYIAWKEKKNDEAVSHFEKANMNSMLDKFYLATAYEAAGKKDKATAIFKEIAGYNFNDITFALVRNEARKKAGM